MASLTETAYFARKGINIGLVLLVVGIVARILFGIAYTYWQEAFPPPPPTATVAFGKLPYPSAQGALATPSAMTYTIETIDSGLPELPPNLKVFFIVRPTASFGSYDRMLQRASSLGFGTSPQLIRTNVWRFVDRENPLRVLDIDELSLQFRISYNYVADPTLFTQKTFTTPEPVIGAARGVFGNLISQNFSQNEPILTYYIYQNGILTPTTTLSGADAVGVSFVRNDIEETPVVSPNQAEGVVSTIISGSTDPDRRSLEVRFFEAEVNTQNWATYPIITSDQAYQMLTEGKGIFSASPTPMPTSFVVREAFVAYLMPYPTQSYLQPVMVFTDQRGLMAYVPLVNPEWLE